MGNSNILSDIEIGDFVVFRNGGLSQITALEYEPMIDGSELVTVEFEDNSTDSWTYTLDGEMFEGEQTGFDIVDVMFPEQIAALFNEEGSNDNQ